MDARIRNFMGVEQADFPLKNIVLLGGRNAAGKSSVLEGLSCVVRGSHEARGVTTKKGAAALVRDGAPAGSAAITWEDGGQRVTWPEAEVQTQGKARFLGSALGIGAVRWMDVPEKRRAAEMAERLQLQPTKEHLVAFLREKEVKQETIDFVWTMVDEQGWDAAHRKAQDQASKLRGRWEQVSGQTFGSQKAAKWRPILLDEAEVYTEEAAAAAVKKAKEEVEALLIAGAISEEEVRRAREASENLGPAQARQKAAQQKIAELDAAIEKATEALAKIGPTDVAVHTYPCPHCERPVWLNREAPNEPYRLVKPPPTLAADELKRRRLETQALEQTIRQKQDAIAAATRDAAQALAEIQAAQAATARLAEIEAMPKANDEKLAEARGAQATAEAVLDAVKAWKAAEAIYADWLRTQPIIEALAPAGVRAKRVAEAVQAFNERLAKISARAAFPVVSVTPETDAMLAGRPYGLLSESERWRVDLVLTLALAELEHASLVLVDRLDMLHPQARPGVFMALHEVGIPAVVACTAKDAAQLPALHRVNVPGTSVPFGRTYWLEDGRLSPVE